MSTYATPAGSDPQLPETVTAELYIAISPYTEKVVIVDSDMTEYGYITLGTHEVTLPVPQVNPATKRITILEAKAEGIRTVYSEQLAMVEEQIKSLRPVELKPEASA